MPDGPLDHLAWQVTRDLFFLSHRLGVYATQHALDDVELCERLGFGGSQPEFPELPS